MAFVTCLCGRQIDASDAESLARAYLAHADREHPQIALSDARREAVAAAIRRSGGWDGASEPLPDDVEIRPLTPALGADYLAFFDTAAFPDNPAWAACYCLSYCLPSRAGESFDERPAAQNRAERAAMIARGEASGVLAYAGPRVAGWCHAAPRAALPALDETPEFAAGEPEATGAIVCYVIAPQFRGQGLARRLLEGACDLLRARGMRWVDAYPPRAAMSAARSYHGRLEMYLAAGFTQVREVGPYVVVRRAL